MRKTSAVGLSFLVSLFGVFASIATDVNAQSTTDFLVQTVCVNGSNVPYFADPYDCPSNRRKLAVGEHLPYHKLDASGVQIGDSYPISDRNGVNVAVQTYYFNHLVTDPAWTSGDEHFQYNFGYNIIGYDSNYVFFAGTWDGGGGWQPWWTAGCQTRGWRLFPNTSYSSLGYGSATSGTVNYPNCTGASNSAAVEYNKANFTYDNGRVIPTVYEFNFSDTNYSSTKFEENYFTEIYGVTRFEAWSSRNSDTKHAKDNCPNASLTATIHGYTFYMNDCRDWAQIDPTAPPVPWNPNGSANYVANLPNWPIDPLYNSTNLLLNTHMGGTTPESGSCSISNWQRDYTSPVLDWVWDFTAIPPMEGASSYNCALQFNVPGAINGQVVYQVQPVPALSGLYTYGVTLWSPGTTGSVYVSVIGRDSSGGVTDNVGFIASTIGIPRTFASSFTINANTRYIYLAMYPQNGGVPFDFSGAWIARAP